MDVTVNIYDYQDPNLFVKRGDTFIGQFAVAVNGDNTLDAYEKARIEIAKKTAEMGGNCVTSSTSMCLSTQGDRSKLLMTGYAFKHCGI